MSSQFEWDAEKDRTNREKHGISFEEASAIFSGLLLTAPDERQDYGEKRFISYGQLSESVVVVVVHTGRSGRTRLISARKANSRERRAYHEHLSKATKGD